MECSFCVWKKNIFLSLFILSFLFAGACVVGDSGSCKTNSDCQTDEFCLYGVCLSSKNDDGFRTEKKEATEQVAKPDGVAADKRERLQNREPNPQEAFSPEPSHSEDQNKEHSVEPVLKERISRDAGAQEKSVPEEKTPEKIQKEASPEPSGCKNGDVRACYTGKKTTRNVSLCKDGTQMCKNGVWEPSCQGQVLPKIEKCDNVDNDCDGKIDNFVSQGVSRPLSKVCYTGSISTRGKGECKDGKATCQSGSWGTCLGQVRPRTETCNRRDDNCDGKIDNVSGFFICPFDEVLIKAGSFTMGSPTSELGRTTAETQHNVKLTHDFYMKKHEVSQKIFKRVMGYNPSLFTKPGDSYPVEGIHWHEAAAFCNGLSVVSKLPTCFICSGSKDKVRCSISKSYSGSKYYQCKGYRLPTEAEWEYAYRAGTTTSLYNGNLTKKVGADPLLDKIAWYYTGTTTPSSRPRLSGMKMPNKYGLFDMSGNLWEWVYDRYGAYPTKQALTIDPIGSTTGTLYILRGGSFNTQPQYCRGASRKGYKLNRFGTYGVRPVRTK